MHGAHLSCWYLCVNDFTEWLVDANNVPKLEFFRISLICFNLYPFNIIILKTFLFLYMHHSVFIFIQRTFNAFESIVFLRQLVEVWGERLGEKWKEAWRNSDCSHCNCHCGTPKVYVLNSVYEYSV